MAIKTQSSDTGPRSPVIMTTATTPKNVPNLIGAQLGHRLAPLVDGLACNAQRLRQLAHRVVEGRQNVLGFHDENSKHASDGVSSMISKHLYILSGMKSVHERVAHAITKSGNTASSVARRLGCSPEAVLQWMNGATKNIRPVNLFALADLTGHSARWLATGEGPQIDAYQNEVIQHVVRAMEHMPPSEQSKFARMADAFIGSPTNDAEIRGGNERSMGS